MFDSELSGSGKYKGSPRGSRHSFRVRHFFTTPTNRFSLVHIEDKLIIDRGQET